MAKRNMSGITLYDVAVPTFTKGLKTLGHILDKAEEFAAEEGLDANAVFPSARLIEDQKPLVFQFQNATKTIRANVDRLTGVETTPFENTETTFEDIRARLDATLELLKTVEPSVANSRAELTVDV